VHREDQMMLGIEVTFRFRHPGHHALMVSVAGLYERLVLAAHCCGRPFTCEGVQMRSNCHEST
jgi:hypothetical protein